MLLRLLLKLLKPSGQQLRRQSNGRLVRCKIRIYQFCLKLLASSYSHYAMSDTIVVDNDAIRITREFRDIDFENELNRNNISFTSPLKGQAFPMTREKNKAKRFFCYFRFEDLLRITIGGKELNIRNNERHTIDGHLNAGLKCSENSKGLSQSVITVSCSNSKSSEHGIPVSYVHQKPENKTTKKGKNQSHRSIFDKEKDISPITATIKETTPESDKYKDIPTIIKAGFEIDTDF